MPLADVALVLWVALWIAMGFAVAHEARALSELSGTVAEVGQATREVGGAVESIGGLPLVGDRVRRLSVLLGIALVAIPVERERA